MPTALLEEKPKDEVSKGNSTPKPVVTPTKKVIESKPVQRFGTQSDKAKVFFAFRNGDKHHTGAKITVHNTKFKTFDQVSLIQELFTKFI